MATQPTTIEELVFVYQQERTKDIDQLSELCSKRDEIVLRISAILQTKPDGYVLAVFELSQQHTAIVQKIETQLLHMVRNVRIETRFLKTAQTKLCE